MGYHQNARSVWLQLSIFANWILQWNKQIKTNCHLYPVGLPEPSETLCNSVCHVQLGRSDDYYFKKCSCSFSDLLATFASNRDIVTKLQMSFFAGGYIFIQRTVFKFTKVFFFDQFIFNDVTKRDLGVLVLLKDVPACIFGALQVRAVGFVKMSILENLTSCVCLPDSQMTETAICVPVKSSLLITIRLATKNEIPILV